MPFIVHFLPLVRNNRIGFIYFLLLKISIKVCIVTEFIKKQGGMMTMTIGTVEKYKEIYEKSKEAATLPELEAAMLLAPYADVNVRIGGWQTPFITLPLDHMENYIKRPTGFKKNPAV